ncbi:linear amide C-N hydrolase [Pseudodesulfovibrio sp.]|uniref:linear amide C-N hydrolase n=1 Tax=unclassified Pseudodesulfovibrio TaxID=2661612 RepID=UPI003AFF658D
MPYYLLTLLLALALFAAPASACSDFVVKAKDGTVLNARSMDFGIEDEAQVAIYPRGKQWSSAAPGKAKGLQWKQRYGFVAMAALKSQISSDGMNEKGLSAKFLWLPSVGYQTVPNGKEAQALAASLVPDWILGNFATVAEVKKALPKVLVWGDTLPQLNGILTIHIAVHDAAGNSIVVEWIDGKLNIYDNQLGIMTNEPPFPGHLANLRNYVNLSPWMTDKADFNGQTVKGTGNGSGMIGLPGDCTPPSRFIRLAVLETFAYQPEKTDDAIVLARRLLEQIYVMKGISRDKTPQGVMADYTQWTSIYDLTHRMMYFADYGDQTLRAIDLTKLDFTRSDYAPIPVRKATGNAIKDVTP